MKRAVKSSWPSNWKLGQNAEDINKGHILRELSAFIGPERVLYGCADVMTHDQCVELAHKLEKEYDFHFDGINFAY